MVVCVGGKGLYRNGEIKRKKERKKERKKNRARACECMRERDQKLVCAKKERK